MAKVVWVSDGTKLQVAEREDREQVTAVPVDEQSGDLPF